MAEIIKSTDGKTLLKVVKIKQEEIIDGDYDCIAKYSFAGLDSLKSVKFTGSIKMVEKNAFFDCRNLTEVIFSNDDVNVDKDFYDKCNGDFRYLKAKQPIFIPITVSELFNKSFYVNDYQRGYRWGKDEVLALLEDIYNCKNKDASKNYYLQPLVLCSKKSCVYTKTLEEVFNSDKDQSERNCEAYEVIDGQQRLTTMYILLSALGCATTTPFKIYYKYVRKTDSDFIKQAKDILNEKIKKKRIDKKSLTEYIEKHVKYIWYEITDPNANPRVLFRDFNSGKTPLTNSELFRAFLFNRNNFIEESISNEEKENRNKELNLISMEWDLIEQSLKNDSFWFFIANSSFNEKNRMDYILDLYASEQEKFNKGLNEKKERYSFNVFVNHFDAEKKDCGSSYEAMRKIWNENIKDIYDRLYSWYLDTKLYNYIGYLIATELTGKDFEDSFVPNYTKEILKLSKKYERDSFEKEVKKKIHALFEEVDIPNLKYKDKDKVKKVLLLTNIWEMTKKDLNLRFPFELYKNSFMDKERKQKIVWNIEHINAHQLSADLIKNCKSAIKSNNDTIDENSPKFKIELKERLDKQIKFLIDELENINSIYNSITYDQKDLEGLKDFLNKKDLPSSMTDLESYWKNICKVINDAFADDDSPVNSISNLTLLDEKTNKGYGNSFFEEKREKIIERDKCGAYIPICTKNIFLKYYGDDASRLNWGTSEMKWLMDNVIVPCINYFNK